MIFDKKQTAESKLSQKEKEAIVDALLLGTYADAKIALSESSLIDRFMESTEWDSIVSYDNYIAEATARVRIARSSDDARKGLLESINARLESRSAKQFALDSINRLLYSDGDVSEEETSLLKEIQSAIKLA